MVSTILDELSSKNAKNGLSFNPRGNLNTTLPRPAPSVAVCSGLAAQQAGPRGLAGGEGPAMPPAASAPPPPQAGEAPPPAHAHVQLRPHGGTG